MPKSNRPHQKKRKKSSNSPIISDETWDHIQAAFNHGRTLRGVMAAGPTGLSVKIWDAVANLPKSHLSEYATKLYPRMKGHELDVKIIKLVRQGRKVIVSHDLVLDESKLKPDTSNKGQSVIQVVVTAERPLRRIPKCEICGRPMSRSYRDRCLSCNLRNTLRDPPPPKIVQGGSPGLPSKRTTKTGKT